MQLRTLSLRHFRNYHQIDLNLHSHFNLIIGKNAQGKTNLLEAVYFLGFLNSFRTSSRQEIIKIGEPAALIESTFETIKGQSLAKVVIEPTKRTVELNGKRPNLYKDYYGQIPVLLFEPRDVYLFRETPSIRRRFINRALFLDQPEGLKIIREYEEVVSQKNRILKDKTGSFRDQIETWNERLIELGAILVSLRLEWIEKVNALLGDEYRQFSRGREEVEIEYKCSFIDQTDQTDPPDRSDSLIVQALRKAIAEKTSEEFARGESVVGPHRDDWFVVINGRNMGAMGSQGENRSCALALKSTQVHLYEKEHGVPPLFLLDDIASELDLSRVEALFSRLRDTRAQTFLTTTEPAPIRGFFKGRGSSFMVEGGQVSVVEN